MSGFEKDLNTELEQIEARGLVRKIRSLRFLDPVRAIDETGREMVVFSSNNYLGLTHAPEVIAAAQRALMHGTGSGGARLTTGGHFEAAELESKLTAFKHAEAALLFNTGYMANLGVISALAKPNDVIFSDELNHASIIDGCRLSRASVKTYRHSDLEDLKRLLQECSCDGRRFIISDGVFSMDGDIALLPGLVRLAGKYQALLIIDEAHATGVIGREGGGTASHYGLEGRIDLQVGTISKALAAEGGYVVGKRLLIEYLKSKSRPFIFSTALSPASAAAATEALSLLRKNGNSYIEKLRSNSELLRKLLTEAGLPIINGVTPIIPIIVGEAKDTFRLANKIAASGVLVSGIRPPTVPEGQSRLRMTVSAAHTEEQIRYAAGVMARAWQER